MGPVRGHQCPYDAPSVAEHFRKTGTVNLNPADILLFRDSLERLEAELSKGYDLTALVNPNNPTGQDIPRQSLVEMLSSSRLRTQSSDIDEAYFDAGDHIESLESRIAAAQSPRIHLQIFMG